MTDPGYMNIQYETLQQAETDLGTAYVAAKTAIDELRAKLDKTLADWDGDARSVYTQVKGEWDAAFAQMAEVLSKAHVHVGNAHEMYQQVERQNVSIWQS